MAVAQVKQVDSDQRRLGVVGEDVGVATFGGGHFLLFAHFFHCAEQLMQSGGFLVAHGLAGGFDALFQLASQVLVAAFQE